jgi:hypothetical protein
MFVIAALFVIVMACGAVLLAVALVGLVFHLLFRVALLPVMVAAGLIKFAALLVAGVALLVAIAVVGPVVLVAGLALLPLLGFVAVVWAGGRLVGLV